MSALLKKKKKYNFNLYRQNGLYIPCKKDIFGPKNSKNSLKSTTMLSNGIGKKCPHHERGVQTQLNIFNIEVIFGGGGGDRGVSCYRAGHLE